MMYQKVACETITCGRVERLDRNKWSNTTASDSGRSCAGGQKHERNKWTGAHDGTPCPASGTWYQTLNMYYYCSLFSPAFWKAERFLYEVRQYKGSAAVARRVHESDRRPGGRRHWREQGWGRSRLNNSSNNSDHEHHSSTCPLLLTFQKLCPAQQSTATPREG